MPNREQLKTKFKEAVSSLANMQKISSLIESKFESKASDLTNISSYLFELGGKKMRPALALMTSQAFGTTTPDDGLIHAAAGIELIHMATLLHDDIIDNSPIRRGKVSPSIKFGTAKALLAGDFLLVRAFALCSYLDEPVVKATEDSCVELTEGEILEIPLNEKISTLEDSLEICRLKTASLFRLASYVGAYYSPLGNKVAEKLASFGENLGIAFQILDDVLDVTATKDTLGKEPFGDIREKKPSIVNVMWLASGDETAKILTSNKSASEEEIIQAKESITHSGAIIKAKELAKDYADKAKEALNSAFEEVSGSTSGNKAIENLNTLIDYTLARIE